MSQLHRGLFCCSRGQCSSFAHYPHQPPLIQIKPMEKLIFTRSSPTKGPPRAMFTRWLAHLALTCPNWLYEYFRAHTYFFPSPSLGAFCVGRDGIYFIWNVFSRFFPLLALGLFAFYLYLPVVPRDHHGDMMAMSTSLNACCAQRQRPTTNHSRVFV